MMMRNITLPTGPYDWHPERVSRTLYETRLARVRGLLRVHGLAGVIVSGSTADDGTLAWLTGFVPKLGPAFALVPVASQPRLLFSGGVGMRSSAQKLTWLDDVAALRSLATDLAPSISGAGKWGIAAEAGLTSDNRHAITSAFGGELVDIGAATDRLRGAHEPEILPMIRRAGAVMHEVESATRAAAANAGTRWAIRLAAERTAHAAGAQDIRLRLSRRSSGPAEPVDPDRSVLPHSAALALAVRVESYWMCGWSWLGAQPPTLCSIWENLTPELCAGSTPASLAEAVSPARIEIVTLGQSLVEKALDAAEPLSSGQCIGVTLMAQAANCGRLSGAVEIATNGFRVLWLATPLQPAGHVS